jgi:hypothetical protein
MPGKEHSSFWRIMGQRRLIAVDKSARREEREAAAKRAAYEEWSRPNSGAQKRRGEADRSEDSKS